MPAHKKPNRDSTGHHIDRKQTIFRLWTDDRKKLFKKLLNDDLRLQTVMETLAMAYLHNDERVMNLVKENAVKGRRTNTERRKYWGMDGDDAAKILEALANESPLKDKDIPFDQ